MVWFKNILGSHKTSGIPIRVSTLGHEVIEFIIEPTITGQELFDHVCSTIGLREKWFFGLQYLDNKNILAWLDLDQKMKHQEVPRKQYTVQSRLQFDLRARFFPEDITEEVIQDATLLLFYKQIRNSILRDEIYCPPDSCILLASFSLQVQYGDRVAKFPIRQNRLLPARVMEQHRLTSEQWNVKIDQWWMQHTGLEKLVAMREYLKIAQDLEMYGVTYCAVTNKAGTKLFLGIDSHGLSVYEMDNQLTPKTGFVWSEMRSAVYNKKQFIIKPIDKKSPNFVCFMERHRLAKRMLVLANGNFKLYMERRNPDRVDILQMKAHEAEMKEAKQADREKFGEAQIARQVCEEKLLNMITEIEFRDNRIRKLEEKLSKMLLVKENLERQQEKLQQLCIQRTKFTTQETAEREKLQNEVRLKQKEYERAIREIREKDDETQRLREEVQRIRQEKLNQTFLVSQAPYHNEASPASEDEEHEEAHVPHETLINDGDLINLPESGPQVPLRKSVIFKDKDIQEQLKKTRDELALNEESSKVTRNDQLHRENMRDGRDKYKTFSDIRTGNTLRRVDFFESM